MPKLSVIMATYDDEKYLPTSIEAILSQSFDDFELIIVNDASPDNSEELIKQYMLKDKRIVYLKNETNLGVVKSSNRGSQIAKGEYMYHASSDDKVLPGFFEETMSALLSNPHISICTSDNAYFNDGNEKTLIIHKLLPEPTCNEIYTSNEIIHLFKTTRFLIIGHCSIFKTQDAKNMEFLNEELECSCDFVLLNTIALTGGAIYIPKILATLRQFPSSQNRRSRKTRKKEIQTVDNWICFLKNRKYLWELFFHSTLLARAIPSRLFTVFLKPKHWDILIPASIMKIKLLFRKLFKDMKTVCIICDV